MDKMREKSRINGFKTMDVLYHLEHHSYELGERWLVIDVEHPSTQYDDMPVYSLVGISPTNRGQRRVEYPFDLSIHDKQLDSDEKRLLEILIA